MNSEKMMDEIFATMVTYEETTRNDYFVSGEITTMRITQKDGEQHEVLVDTEDYYRVDKGGKWYVNKNNRSDDLRYVFRKIKVNGKWTTESLHRFITNTPKGLVVDHINHNTLDNRKTNLKPCSHAENMRNRRKKQEK
jgi:hypothetical protein